MQGDAGKSTKMAEILAANWQQNGRRKCQKGRVRECERASYERIEEARQTLEKTPESERCVISTFGASESKGLNGDFRRLESLLWIGD
jgi:hypothetical protein